MGLISSIRDSAIFSNITMCLKFCLWYYSNVQEGKKINLIPFHQLQIKKRAYYFCFKKIICMFSYIFFKIYYGMFCLATLAKIKLPLQIYFYLIAFFRTYHIKYYIYPKDKQGESWPNRNILMNNKLLYRKEKFHR